MTSVPLALRLTVISSPSFKCCRRKVEGSFGSLVELVKKITIGAARDRVPLAPTTWRHHVEDRR